MATAVTLNSQELTKELMERVLALPEGGKIRHCIQCGTCSGSCPTSHLMDYTPREIIAALRGGMLDRVLNSSTMWLCSSCYGCTVRCPAGIKLTDVMYQLKSMAMRHGILPKDLTTPAFQEAFVAEVQAHGRNSEVGLMRRFFLRTNPLNGLRNLGLALAMKQRGRLSLTGSTISSEGRRQLKAIADKVRGE